MRNYDVIAREILKNILWVHEATVKPSTIQAFKFYGGLHRGCIFALYLNQIVLLGVLLHVCAKFPEK